MYHHNKFLHRSLNQYLVFPILDVLNTFDKKEISNAILANKKKEELNIRHCLGEAVPTGVFKNIASNIISGLNPAIIHNIEKYWAIKKTVYLNSLEQQIGDYVEFGVYTGSSFCHSIRCFNKHEKFNPNQRQTKFIGFDSFEGFGKLDDFDQHPFYIDQNFKTDFRNVKKRVEKTIARNGRDDFEIGGKNGSGKII